MLASGHARTEVADHFLCFGSAEHIPEPPFERFRCLETPARVEVVPEVPVARARNAPAHGVESLVLPAEAIRRTCVDEHHARIVEAGADKLCTDPAAVD